MPSRPWTYTCAESQALQQTVQPSGKTLEDLTLKIVEYGRIHTYCAEILSKDVGQVQELYSRLTDPRTPQPEVIVTSAPGASIRAFGMPGNVDLEGLHHTFAKYDEYLEKKRQTFEEHFWASQYAATAAILMEQYFVFDPLKSWPVALRAFRKRFAQLHEEIAKEVIAQRSVQPNAAAPVNYESPVTHAKDFGLPRLANLNSTNSVGAVASRISLPEADGIAADIGALREKRFRIIAPEGVVGEDEAVDEIDPNSWRISGLDFDTSMYNIVFGNIPNHPIQVHKDELLRLLTDSQLVQL